jgi:hypothetical protein
MRKKNRWKELFDLVLNIYFTKESSVDPNYSIKITLNGDGEFVRFKPYATL